MFSVGETVIIYNAGAYEVGRILKKYKKRGYRVYDVVLERGVTFVMLRIDNNRSSIYIDSKKTKALSNKIQTTITNEFSAQSLQNLEEITQL